MNPLRRPKLWARILGTALLVLAAWLLLVPITVAYLTSDPNSPPQPVSTMYSWWTTEQDLIYTDPTGADLTKPDGLSLDKTRLIEAFRLNCGNAFTTGPHEQVLDPDGPDMCASAETPRRIIGLSAFGFGVLGLLAALRLPVEPERYRNRYHLTYQQRRQLKRGR